MLLVLGHLSLLVLGLLSLLVLFLYNFWCWVWVITVGSFGVWFGELVLGLLVFGLGN